MKPTPGTITHSPSTSPMPTPGRPEPDGERPHAGVRQVVRSLRARSAAPAGVPAAARRRRARRSLPQPQVDGHPQRQGTAATMQHDRPGLLVGGRPVDHRRATATPGPDHHEHPPGHRAVVGQPTPSVPGHVALGGRRHPGRAHRRSRGPPGPSRRSPRAAAPAGILRAPPRPRSPGRSPPSASSRAHPGPVAGSVATGPAAGGCRAGVVQVPHRALRADRRQRAGEVLGRRRRRGGPLEGVAAPRVVARHACPGVPAASAARSTGTAASTPPAGTRRWSRSG